MKIPKIGMGTFGSDRYSDEVVADAVRSAIDIGYKMFDCASVYGNEKNIGDVFNESFKSGKLKREETIVISKVWNDMHGEGKVIESCKKSIKDLKCGYIDIYFVHWPFPNFHSKGCDANSRCKDSKPFFAEDFMTVWRQMEFLKNQGYVREIAMSNMTVPKFEQVLPLCEIKPFAHEMELHPTFRQKELYDYCKKNEMEIIGYCPLGSPNRPERDRTPEDISDTAMPVIRDLAEKYNVHPAEICLAWAVKSGHTPIPFASRRENLVKNYRISQSDILTDEDMKLLETLPSDNRLVKGHVFLWDGARDWKDLWDEKGVLEKWLYDGNAFSIASENDKTL